jgi:hypothetical protein
MKKSDLRKTLIAFAKYCMPTHYDAKMIRALVDQFLKENKL